MARRLIYRSTGTDEMGVACESVENAVNCFRADCEAMLAGDVWNDDMEISLEVIEISDEQFAVMQEV